VETLYKDDCATLEDLHEAVTTLAETERTARRVFGNSHPTVVRIARALGETRGKLAARETGSA